jgi:hypothetical protein
MDRGVADGLFEEAVDDAGTLNGWPAIALLRNSPSPAAAFCIQRRAWDGFFATPVQFSYMRATSHCPAASPWSAALRNQRIASTPGNRVKNQNSNAKAQNRPPTPRSSSARYGRSGERVGLPPTTAQLASALTVTARRAHAGDAVRQ